MTCRSTFFLNAGVAIRNGTTWGLSGSWGNILTLPIYFYRMVGKLRFVPPALWHRESEVITLLWLGLKCLYLGHAMCECKTGYGNASEGSLRTNTKAKSCSCEYSSWITFPDEALSRPY